MRVAGGMRVRAYVVLRRAVEEGVEYGWRRAHKYAETPDPEHIRDQIEEAVLGEISNCFAFDDETEEET